MSFLNEIIVNQRRKVEKQKATLSRLKIEGDPQFDRPILSMVSALEKSETGIIAEFKRKSPSKGWFKPAHFNVDQVVKAYKDGGAAGISILTEEDFFGGSLKDLEQARKLGKMPLLRKDFILDPWQIAESKQTGADLILLIAACLSSKEVIELARYGKSIGLEVLLEIHNEKELDHICEEVDLVGINNRNLENFDVNIETSFRLIEKMEGKPAIAESGISNTHTLIELKQAGFTGFLIGERFMKEPDPGKAFKDFVAGLTPG